MNRFVALVMGISAHLMDSPSGHAGQGAVRY